MKKRLQLIAFLLLTQCLCAAEALAANKQESSMLGLRTATYTFADLAKAKAWYAEAFGIQPYFDEPYYVGFNVRGFELGLVPQSDKPNGDNVIAYWGVTDIDAEYARLISLGAKAHNPVADVGGGIRLGTLHDPFGNVLGLIYNPHFKAQ